MQSAGSRVERHNQKHWIPHGCSSSGVEHIVGTSQVNWAQDSCQEGLETRCSHPGSVKLAEVSSLERGLIRSALQRRLP